MPTNRFSATVIISFFLVLVVQGARTIKARYFIHNNQMVPDHKTKGPANAEITIIEFTDFECPACATGAKVMSNYLEKYPGKIFIQYRHFPLSSHKNSTQLAVAAECAAQQGQFWPYHDILFTRQATLNNSMRIEGRLLEIARELGLDTKSFESCQDNPDTELTVIAEKKDGESREIKATPTYLLNGKILVGSNVLREELEKMLATP